ncbi:hypothetical protein QQP08_002453 [Theobroma cacao]|nr:hypothetical protein QQP08_002453 [Theobroma cacao]
MFQRGEATHIRARFRSWDLWVMGPPRFRCATLIVGNKIEVILCPSLKPCSISVEDYGRRGKRRQSFFVYQYYLFIKTMEDKAREERNASFP